MEVSQEIYDNLLILYLSAKNFVENGATLGYLRSAVQNVDNLNLDTGSFKELLQRPDNIHYTFDTKNKNNSIIVNRLISYEASNEVIPPQS